MSVSGNLQVGEAAAAAELVRSDRRGSCQLGGPPHGTEVMAGGPAVARRPEIASAFGLRVGSNHVLSNDVLLVLQTSLLK